MFAVNIFLNQVNQDVLVAWLLSNVGGLENSRTHLSFLENKHHKIDLLPLFMNREMKHLANLLEIHLKNKNGSQRITHFPLYSTHQDFKMKIPQSGWISC